MGENITIQPVIRLSLCVNFYDEGLIYEKIASNVIGGFDVVGLCINH